MSTLWPWLAVAGLGALHGLNPASGWLPAMVWGLRSRDRRQALWALIPIAAGHAASVTLVALAVAFGLDGRFAVSPESLAALLLACGVVHLIGRPQQRTPAAHAGLALGSFWMSSAHGAGLMLVPALMPLCVGSTAAGQIVTARGVLGLALGAVAVHTLAMLAVTAAIALGAGQVWDITARRLRRSARGPAPVGTAAAIVPPGSRTG